MQGYTQRCSINCIAKIGSKIPERNRQDLYFATPKIRNDWNPYIDNSKNRPNRGTDTEYRPFPSLFLRPGILGQRHSRKRRHRRGWEGQLFAIGSEAKEHIARGKPGYTSHDCTDDQQQNWGRPIAVNKGPFSNSLGIRWRSPPPGQNARNSELLGFDRTNEVLPPEQI